MEKIIILLMVVMHTGGVTKSGNNTYNKEIIYDGCA